MLSVYSRSISHRLLRIPSPEREGLSVMKILSQMHQLASQLIPTAVFCPEKIWSVRLAIFIDRFPLAGKLFRVFKKVYPEAIL